MRKWKSALLFLLSWAERVAANLKAVVWYFWFIYLFCVQKWEKPVTLCMVRIFAQRRFSLGWIILYAFHLLIVLLCLYCDFVYTRSNVLTGCVNDGVSIGASLQIVSIIKTHADSVWGSCFSSFAPSSLHLWYLRKSLLFIQFWNHFHVRTLMTVTFSWKSLNTYQFIPSRENHVTVSYVYTRKQCVVYPLGYPCSSELCILVCFSQADLHFNIIYIPSPNFMSSYISRNINLKPYLSCIANAAVCSNNTDPLVSSLISDQRPQLRSSRPRASVTTWEWQRVSHSSGAWAKLSVTAAKQPSNLSWLCN